MSPKAGVSFRAHSPGGNRHLNTVMSVSVCVHVTVLCLDLHIFRACADTMCAAAENEGWHGVNMETELASAVLRGGVGTWMCVCQEMF